MKNQYAVLNKEDHCNTRVAAGISAESISSQHIIPVTVTEFEKASGELPIVFVKNSETGQFESVVVLGFEKGENLCVKNGKWIADFKPQIIQRAPFGLSEDSSDSHQLLVVIDESSQLVNSQKGELLFDKNGAETEYLIERKRKLQDFHEGSMYGQLFIQRMAELKLLELSNITLEINGKKVLLEGIYVVNQDKLKSLTNDKFLELRKHDILSAIYAHLFSLRKFNYLVKLKQQN